MSNLVFQANSGGSITLTGANTSGTATITIPATTGTFITTGDTGTVTNTMLANSSITINGTSVSLGGSTTITNAGTLTISTGLTGSSYNGTTNVTIAIDTSVVTTLTGTQTLTNKTLTNPVVTAYLETAPALTNSSTAVTLSLSSGTVLSYTLTGNCTFTMPTATSGTSFIVKLIQDGTGSRTATFTGVKWPAGTAPTITTTATTGTDILSFVCINSIWYGTYAQAFA